MDISILPQQIGHLIALFVFGWLVVAGYRWIHRRSQILGFIVALGILGRLVVGLALFWISYLELPIAESLQAGGGFWQVAVDATRYYSDAISAIQTGVFSANYESFPSPLFVKVLAFWLLLVGISPASGLFLNVCVYSAVVFLIVKMYRPVNDWRRDLPCIVGVGAYSFWPAIFIHGTQPLKDDFFFALIAVVCLGLLGIFRLLTYGRPAAGRLSVLALGAVAVLAAMFGLAGIRWYFPIMVCGALAVVFAIFTIRGRSTPLPRYLAGSLLILIAMWLAAGGPSNFASRFLFPVQGQSGVEVVGSIAHIPSTLASLTQLARTGFLLTGGDTNIVVPLSDDGQTRAMVAPETFATVTPERMRRSKATPSAMTSGGPALSEEQADAMLAIPRNRSEHLKTIVMGVAIVFVPISLLKALSVVDFPGGRGFLPIADLDTLFQDAAIFCLLWLLWTRRQTIGTSLPFVAFCVILAGTTAILLGYVVTNYGTLFRMRPMMAIPLCVLVVALSSRGDGSGRPMTRPRDPLAAS